MHLLGDDGLQALHEARHHLRKVSSSAGCHIHTLASIGIPGTECLGDE